MKILAVFGTRPEAIKMSILVQELLRERFFDVKVCVTGQHREMLDQVLKIFEIAPDFDLDIMSSNQDLADVTTKVIIGVRDLLKEDSYDLILVHGDTTTSLAAALAGFYENIQIGHIEAGLRTYDKYNPWPEEMNRQLTSKLATYHFAPTKKNKENLLQENIPEEDIEVTGNTVIDALHWISEKFNHSKKVKAEIIKNLSYAKLSKKNILNWVKFRRKMILITGHRRENFGKGFNDICEAIFELSKRYPDVDFVYPVHLNPNVRKAVASQFGNNFLDTSDSNTFFIEPLNYMSFIFLLKHCHFVLTDSGGIQEEAPSLSKPVLVMRETTERQEAVKAGTVKLVGTNKENIKKEVTALIEQKDYYNKMSIVNNPYGNGDAARKVVNYLKQLKK